MAFELPKLPYAYDALEPYVDAETMHLHHTKHQQKYLDFLNAYIESVSLVASLDHHAGCGYVVVISLRGTGTTQDKGAYLKGMSAVQIVQAASEGHVRNNGGGYHNHSCGWAFTLWLGPMR